LAPDWLLGAFGWGRESKDDSGAVARRGGESECSTMKFNWRFYQRQAQPCAFILAAHRSIDLGEGLQRRFDVFFMHADAGIGYRNLEGTVSERDLYPDRSVWFGELDRVGQKVDQNLFDQSFVGDEGRQIAGGDDNKREMSFRGPFADEPDRAVDDAGEFAKTSAGFEVHKSTSRSSLE